MSTPFNLVVFPEPVKPKQINRFERLKPSDLSTEEADAVVALALAVMKKRHRRGGLITSPQSAVEHLRLRLGELDHERFEVIYLDTRNRIIAIESLFRGTIDGANVHPRDVIASVIRNQASRVMLCHNHPSGECEPSAADRQMTRKLSEALAMIDVKILDHIIVSATQSYSFAEHGIMP